MPAPPACPPASLPNVYCYCIPPAGCLSPRTARGLQRAVKGTVPLGVECHTPAPGQALSVRLYDHTPPSSGDEQPMPPHFLLRSRRGSPLDKKTGSPSPPSESSTPEQPRAPQGTPFCRQTFGHWGRWARLRGQTHFIILGGARIRCCQPDGPAPQTRQLRSRIGRAARVARSRRASRFGCRCCRP